MHCIKIHVGDTVQDSVFKILDRFMTRHLLCKTADLTIIVGKGLGSRSVIEGKNPLRYYTEKYLEKVGCAWTNGDFWNGQDGCIRVRW